MQNPIDLEARYCAQNCRPLPVDLARVKIRSVGAEIDSAGATVRAILEALMKAGPVRLTA